MWSLRAKDQHLVSVDELPALGRAQQRWPVGAPAGPCGAPDFRVNRPELGSFSCHWAVAVRGAAVPESLAQTGSGTGPSQPLPETQTHRQCPNPEGRRHIVRHKPTQRTHSEALPAAPGLRITAPAPTGHTHTHTCVQPRPDVYTPPSTHTLVLCPVGQGVGAQVSSQSWPEQVRGCPLDPNDPNGQRTAVLRSCGGGECCHGDESQRCCLGRQALCRQQNTTDLQVLGREGRAQRGWAGMEVGSWGSGRQVLWDGRTSCLSYRLDRAC